MSIRLTGMNSGLDTDAMVKELVSAYTKKGETNVKNKTKAEWKQEAWNNLNKKLKAFNAKVKSMQYSTSYSQKKTTSSNENKVSVIAADNAVRGTQTIKVKSLATTAYVTSGEIQGASGEKITSSSKLSDLGVTSEDGKITLTQGDKVVEIDANKDTTVGDFVKKLNAAGLSASFDEGNGRMFISAKESGKASNFEFSGDAAALSALGLTKDSGASIIKGANAEIMLNDAEFESTSNAFNINGMAITVKGLTAKGKDGEYGEDAEVITLTTDTDTDAIYKNVKSIIKEYSDIINELSKLYNADTAKGYEPLTDDEKDAMSDDEVEKWEQKIKDSLLRRDSNVSSVMNIMKNASAKSYNVGGTEYTLADFGIGTLGYFNAEDNEKNALHINGDEDDADVSGQANKLKQMIAGDPDAVAGFFSKFMTEISDQFNKITTSTTNRSYGNFFDDKKMKSDLSNYEKKISEWEEYVKDVEDKYYKQFTKMETALAKLNSTQTSLSNYFS